MGVREPLAADHVGAYVSALRPDAVHVFHLLHLSAAVIEPLRALEVPLVMSATDFWSFCVRGNLSKPSGEMCRGPDDISSNCLECRRVDEWYPRGSSRPGSASAILPQDRPCSACGAPRRAAQDHALAEGVGSYAGSPRPCVAVRPDPRADEADLRADTRERLRVAPGAPLPFGMDAEPFRGMKRLAGRTARAERGSAEDTGS